MPIRSAQSNAEVISGTTLVAGNGFTYHGFTKGVVDPEIEWINEVSLLYSTVVASTVRMVHFNSAGTVKNDVTTAAFTPGAAFATSDGTLATNTVNTGANFPWTLAAGDSVAITAVTGAGQQVSATMIVAIKGA